MIDYRLITNPTCIPVPGNKLIEEFMGNVNTGTSDFSVAHMVAPPGWEEPAQVPEFGELTIMLRGRMHIAVGEDEVVLAAGQVFWVDAGVRVRYANPHPEESEYWAICMPAFHPDKANRE